MNIADPKQYEVFGIHLMQKIDNCLCLTDVYMDGIASGVNTNENTLEAKRQFGKVEAYMDVLKLLYTDEYDKMLNDRHFQETHWRMKKLERTLRDVF